jgi:hypothetical protein
MKKPEARKSSENGLHFAWQVHNHQVAWIEKADFKASLLLPVQFGILTILGAVLLSVRRPHLNPLVEICVVLGLVILGIAILLTTLVVLPRLGGDSLEKNDLIHFGHLRRLDAVSIKDLLVDLDAEGELSALSRQLSVLSTVNWKKHQLIWWGIVATSLGAGLCSIPLLISWLLC